MIAKNTLELNSNDYVPLNTDIGDIDLKIVDAITAYPLPLVKYLLENNLTLSNSLLEYLFERLQPCCE